MPKNLTILIIDDDEISLLILQNAFEMKGFNVITSTNSLNTIDLIKKYSPNVMILDIFMPEKNGFEIINELKKLDFKFKPLVVAISSDEDSLSAIKKLGARLTLHKSTMPHKIVEAVMAL